jgi:O-antigen/teichoic acid export membrane protein
VSNERTNGPAVDLRALVRRGATGSGSVQIAGIGIAFLLHLVLARTMGIEAYGLYLYAITWTSVLALLARLGLDTAAARFVPALLARNEPALLSGFLRRGSLLVAAGSIVAMALFALLVGGVQTGMFAVAPDVFWVAAPLIPLVAATHWQKGILRGLHRVVRAEFADRIVLPILMLGAVVVILAHGDAPADAEIFISIQVAATALAAALAAFWVCRAVAAYTGSARVYETGTWLRSAMPMAIVAVAFLVMSQIDILMVGWLRGASEAGTYGIAARVSSLSLLGLLAINTILGPVLADLHTRGRTAGLQGMMNWSGRLNLTISAGATALLLITGPFVLSLFGIVHPDGFTALAILLAGYLAGAAFGSVGLLLTMTGQERAAAAILLAAIAANIVLNALLIPSFGITGAATATALTTFFWRAAMGLTAWRRLGTRPVPLSFSRS